MNSRANHTFFLASVGLLALATALHVATSIPVGTILPVSLNSTLSSTRCKPGQIITARIMQNVPLPGGSVVRAGAKVIGHIVSVTPSSNGAPASVSIRFDTLKTPDAETPILTNLRAIASFMAIHQAQIPLMGPDRGTPESAWTTVQVGGETLYRGGGHLEGNLGRVGEPVAGGVLSRVISNPERGCRGEVEGNDAPQALWVFSSNACGVYGLTDLTIHQAGRRNPSGEIVLESTKGQVNVRAGAGLLLRVVSPDAPGA